MNVAKHLPEELGLQVRLPVNANVYEIYRKLHPSAIECMIGKEYFSLLVYFPTEPLTYIGPPSVHDTPIPAMLKVANPDARIYQIQQGSRNNMIVP